MKNVNVVVYFGVLLLVVVWLFFRRKDEKASGASPLGMSPIVTPTVTAFKYFQTELKSGDGENSMENSGILQTDTGIYGTSTGNGRITIQTDGNFLVHRGWGELQWAAGTNPLNSGYIAMQPDGSICLYSPYGHGWDNARWCFGTENKGAGPPYTLLAGGGEKGDSSIGIYDKNMTRLT